MKKQLTTCFRVIRWLLPLSLLLTGGLALADEHWRNLHKEVEAGRIQSLATVLSNLEKNYIGQVIEVEFEQEDGQAIYEIEMIGPAGQVVEFEIDAVSGDVVSIEGRNIKGMERQ
ncbi:Peptidase propeptide domain-containing protein [Spongiibacter sp. IMCC21906]|uniref:PepSY domain-containing protein n=1 Tax=Spongiibacter sp. IMCC21906 TaxID=1620392 RepID=UPI00062DDD40|nr:PepSY domain-containing protein [Spongiibacter sp. IMCC21906]AKH68228.1 Peptidase propeptide domain-containing protein [Spongiibacter sp. IMCC21906]